MYILRLTKKNYASYSDKALENLFLHNLVYMFLIYVLEKNLLSHLLLFNVGLSHTETIWSKYVTTIFY